MGKVIDHPAAALMREVEEERASSLVATGVHKKKFWRADFIPLLVISTGRAPVVCCAIQPRLLDILRG
jgi:hypothetical protein